MKLIPMLCLSGILLAPIISKPIKTEFTKDSKGQLRDTEFTIKVTNINKSNSGFTVCSYYIQKTESSYSGPCTTTDNLLLKVGRNYLVTKANINVGGSSNIISINKAKLIEDGPRLKVVATFVRAGTSLAELENGAIIDNSDGLLQVGDYATVD